MNNTTNQNTIQHLKEKVNPETAKVLNIALYLIYLAKENNEEMNNVKLQKLLYYCQAWELAEHNKKLFDNKIEAWVHGGVVPDLYFYMREKDVDSREIKDYVVYTDIDLTEEEKDTVQKVFECYGGFSGADLEIFNHREKAWRKARAGLDIDQIGTQEIDTELMKEYNRIHEPSPR